MDYKELKRLIGLLKLGDDLTSYAESKLMNFIKEQETKQLNLTDVVASVLCINSDKFEFVQKDKKYELIKESEDYFTIYDDEGGISIYEKECFKKL